MGRALPATREVSEVRELCNRTYQVLEDSPGEPSAESCSSGDLQGELGRCRTSAHLAVGAAERLASERRQLMAKLEELERERRPTPATTAQEAQAAKAPRSEHQPVAASVASGYSEALSGKRTKPKRTVAPSGALRSIAREEEALQKSLLRMDFEEMKRQFSGQKPLWREDQALGESFKMDPYRESKLEASLQRLDAAFGTLQEQHEAFGVRMKKQAALGRPRGAPSAIPHPRSRPRSSVGRTYSGGRTALGARAQGSEVPTIHAVAQPCKGREVGSGPCDMAEPAGEPTPAQGAQLLLRTAAEACLPALRAQIEATDLLPQQALGALSFCCEVLNRVLVNLDEPSFAKFSRLKVSALRKRLPRRPRGFPCAQLRENQLKQ
eukprot:g33499.t1